LALKDFCENNGQASNEKENLSGFSLRVILPSSPLAAYQITSGRAVKVRPSTNHKLALRRRIRVGCIEHDFARRKLMEFFSTALYHPNISLNSIRLKKASYFFSSLFKMCVVSQKGSTSGRGCRILSAPTSTAPLNAHPSVEHSTSLLKMMA
jgi:hypothetical protein